MDLSKTGWNYPFYLAVYFYLITAIFKNTWKMHAKQHFSVYPSVPDLLLLSSPLPSPLPDCQVFKICTRFHMYYFLSIEKESLFRSCSWAARILHFVCVAEKPRAGHFAIPAACHRELTDAGCAGSHMATSRCSSSCCSPESRKHSC